MMILCVWPGRSSSWMKTHPALLGVEGRGTGVWEAVAQRSAPPRGPEKSPSKSLSHGGFTRASSNPQLVRGPRLPAQRQARYSGRLTTRNGPRLLFERENSPVQRRASYSGHLVASFTAGVAREPRESSEKARKHCVSHNT